MAMPRTSCKSLAMSGLLLLLAAGRGAHSGTGEWLSGRMEELVNERMCSNQ